MQTVTHNPLENPCLLPCHPHLPAVTVTPSHTNTLHLLLQPVDSEGDPASLGRLSSFLAISLSRGLISRISHRSFGCRKSPFKEPFKDHRYRLLNKSMPFSHRAWGIRGNRENRGEENLSLSFPVFMRRRPPRGWLLSFPSFPPVQGEESPWPDAEGCGTKLAAPRWITKSSPRENKKKCKHQKETQILLLLTLSCPHNLTPRTSSLLIPTAKLLTNSEALRIPTVSYCASDARTWNHKDSFLPKPCQV